MLKTAVYSSFKELPAHFPQFLARAEKRNFFIGKGWFENFSQNTIDEETKLRIYTVSDYSEQSKPRTILFMRNPGGQNGSYSQKIFSGTKTLASLTAHQSIKFAPVIDKDDQQYEQVLDALIKSVCEDEQNWNLIDLNFLNKKSRIFKLLSKSLSNHNMQVSHYDYRANIYEDLSELTFKDYLSSRPSIVKKTYTRKARKLAKDYAVRFEIIKHDNKLEQAILDYSKVLANSWKEPEHFPKHDAGVIRSAAKAGALRLGLLYIDDKPVAAQIWLVSNSKATIYKLHYDLKYKQESVGAVLMLRMFEYIIDVEHIQVVDFGVGDETAKSFWLNKQRFLSGIVAFNTHTPKGLLAFSRYSSNQFVDRGKQSLKPLYHSIKSMPITLDQVKKLRLKYL